MKCLKRLCELFYNMLTDWKSVADVIMVQENDLIYLMFKESALWWLRSINNHDNDAYWYKNSGRLHYVTKNINWHSFEVLKVDQWSGTKLNEYWDSLTKLNIDQEWLETIYKSCKCLIWHVYCDIKVFGCVEVDWHSLSAYGTYHHRGADEVIGGWHSNMNRDWRETSSIDKAQGFSIAIEVSQWWSMLFNDGWGGS